MQNKITKIQTRLVRLKEQKLKIDNDIKRLSEDLKNLELKKQSEILGKISKNENALNILLEKNLISKADYVDLTGKEVSTQPQSNGEHNV